MVSLKKIKQQQQQPFLAIRDIAAAESILQYAASAAAKIEQCFSTEITCMFSSLMCFTCYRRAPHFFRIRADWFLQADR